MVEETGTGMAEESNLKESKRDPNQLGARLEMIFYNSLIAMCLITVVQIS